MFDYSKFGMFGNFGYFGIAVVSVVAVVVGMFGMKEEGEVVGVSLMALFFSSDFIE